MVPTLMPPSSALHAWVLQHPFSASIVVTALCWPVCGCTTAILSGVASAAILCCLSNYSTPSANAARSLAASSSASIIDGSRRLIARIPTSAPIRAESCYICDTSWQRSFIGMTDVVVAGQPQWFCIQVRDAVPSTTTTTMQSKLLHASNDHMMLVHRLHQLIIDCALCTTEYECVGQGARATGWLGCIGDRQRRCSSDHRRRTLHRRRYLSMRVPDSQGQRLLGLDQA